YGFLQTPPLASGALASRIVFPSVGVTPSSFRWPGLPASPGKQQKAATSAALYGGDIRPLPCPRNRAGRRSG
ncbi:hypothetical protein C7I36_14475, partial [Zobellella taiwanensis]